MVYTASEMREMDKNTIQSGTPSIKLMHNASRAVLDVVVAKYSHAKKILVVCGNGNNGGDGFCIACMLNDLGKEVSILEFYGKKSEDAEYYYLQAKNKNISFVDISCDVSAFDLIIDAIFGTGLAREIEGEFLIAIRNINASNRPCLSVDIPSGLNSDNGLVMGDCVKANITVTFVGHKYGHLLNDGRDFCGEVVVKQIGVNQCETNGGKIFSSNDFCQMFPKRKINTHKGTNGRCGVIAGSESYFGAGVLSESAVSALLSGAGYCFLGCANSLADLYRLKNPEVLVTPFSCEDGKIKFVKEEQDAFLKQLDSVSVGMGLCDSIESYKIVENILMNHELNVLIDADGINSLARFNGVELLKKTKCKVVLTPHVKEFSRLIRMSVDDITKSSVEIAKTFAAQHNIVLLLKNATTIITDGNEVILNISGSPSMAKSGSGDVLSGVIGGLLAAREGKSFLKTVCAGAFIFGKAGEIAECEKGQASVLASDIVSCLHKAFISVNTVNQN